MKDPEYEEYLRKVAASRCFFIALWVITTPILYLIAWLLGYLK